MADKNNVTKRKICIVTGARADYGLFYPLLKKIRDDGEFRIQIIATCMHLSVKFGLTYKDIEKDGFKINEKADILLYGDTELGITRSIALGIKKFAYTLNRLKPDTVVLLGDRFETFAAAVAAFVANIPIAHIHGGELTEGAMDDVFRHSITKMSRLHFVSAEEYRKRVMQMGESPGSIFNVGALSIDNIRNTPLLMRNKLEQELNFKFGPVNLLVTFHPATMERNTSELQFKELLGALDYFDDARVIFTESNSDVGGRSINKLIDKYVRANNPVRAVSFASMGRLRYLSAMQYVDAVVGNSSSGIVEAPSFGKPTVNVGDRQKGRIMPESVINTLPGKEAIINALKQALSPAFRKKCRHVKNIYGDGDCATKIVNILKKRVPEIRNTKKRFYDFRKD